MDAPEGLSAVAATGDRVATLRALRGALAAGIEDAESSRDLAALSRQLTLVLAEIAELAPAKTEGTPLDDLAQRRSARKPSAPRKARASGGK